MTDKHYHVQVLVTVEGQAVDITEIVDEDYGWAMARLAQWAVLSYGEKDL